MPGRVWSDQEKEDASTLYAQGAGRKELALLTDRSEIAIKRAVTAFGWQRDLSFVHDLSRFESSGQTWRFVLRTKRYAVSNHGSVMSLQPGFVGKILRCWTDPEGYVHATLELNGTKVRRAVHQLVAEAFLSPQPSPLHEIAHFDGNPANNADDNLRWATKKQNYADRVRHGHASRNVNGPGYFIKETKVV